VTATQDASIRGVTPNIDVAPVQKRRGKPMPWPLNLYQTAVGKKWVMALTGIGLMGFVAGHMVGNAKMFLGEAEYNEYSEGLRNLLVPLLPVGFFLWIVRVGLIAIFAIHLHCAYSLTMMNRRARPTQYSRRDYVAANFAARTMRYSGILVLAFLFMHLANLTWGWFPAGVQHHAGVPTDVYGDLVTSLSIWWIAVLYIIGNVALGFHLFHGAWSLFQSLGVNNPRYNAARKGFAYLFTAVVVGVNISFPIMVLAGVVD
jgi:succinate dehydrogenase / fumarate reductase cytochrome b subunit